MSSGRPAVAKRLFDLVIGTLLLAMLSPIQAAAALLVRLTSPGPILHRAVRTGRDGAPFTLYKFRTMVIDADTRGPGITGPTDTRITPAGRFLRRTHLDELPQLWNVVRGDMSLVGPRPEDPRFTRLYTPEQRQVLTVRPGITGAAQLRYQDERRLLDPHDPERSYVESILPAKVAVDLEYVRHRTLLGDLRILLQSLRAVLPLVRPPARGREIRADRMTPVRDASPDDPDHSNREVERMARVYEGYERGEVWRRWDQANAGNRAVLRERRSKTRRLLAEAGLLPLGTRSVLDVGCGVGHELAWYRERGADPANLHGIDLLRGRIERARAAYPALDFQVGNAEVLPYPADSFDLLIACTLFSSILDEPMARNVAAQMLRVLRPGGSICWYDFRYDNPRNAHVRGMSRSRIESLFEGTRIRLSTLTLLPPLARRLGPLTNALYPTLAVLRPLRTHYLGLLTKPGAS